MPNNIFKANRECRESQRERERERQRERQRERERERKGESERERQAKLNIENCMTNKEYQSLLNKIKEINVNARWIMKLLENKNINSDNSRIFSEDLKKKKKKQKRKKKKKTCGKWSRHLLHR